MRYSESSNRFNTNSVLLNAEENTNFIYKVSNIKNKEAQIQFEKISNEIFECNLTLIDSFLPKIMAELVLHSYLNNINSIAELTQILEKENPLGYNYTNSQHFYEYKLKRFLEELANGMLPNKVWDGKCEANEGYLFIKENGDIVCYHIYNKNIFEDYLFFNTKLETASSTRHEFRTIYEENGELYIKLNLQVRLRF